ncbi:hypothetical protein tpqmel_0657 [Candidatus Gastranaerophilus sp. (ex Termes propinquus)]|nr:hypothetical protein tpqmel_0657 [Candidatus Gastranaerophilus sp. (ex Termes propinquus)]
MSNFLGFAKSYIIRNNPVKIFVNNMVVTMKEVFSITKKKKVAQYRLSYQMYKLRQMETLIAANNDHHFLKGKKFNEMR